MFYFSLFNYALEKFAYLWSCENSGNAERNLNIKIVIFRNIRIFQNLTKKFENIFS